MKLRVDRIAKKSTHTIGRLYVDGGYVCDTLEDAVRDAKIKHKTAIPEGIYKVAMTITSPKYSQPKYRWAKKYGGKLPRLIDVPGYEGILIHVGNTVNDTSGCILVGRNTIVGQLTHSTKCFTELMDKYLVPAMERKEPIEIEIK